MSDHGLHIRCQRCGTAMEMRDPGPGMPWTPDQFWVCPRCGRHFWSTYPPPKVAEAKPPAEPKLAAEAKPPVEPKPVAGAAS